MPATGGGAFFSESGKIPTPETLDPAGQGRKRVSIAGGFPVAAARSGFGMMTAGILTVMVFFLSQFGKIAAGIRETSETVCTQSPRTKKQTQGKTLGFVCH